MLIGAVGFSTASALPHHACGQQVVQPGATVIQQPTFQPQNQIYQPPVYQTPVYQPPGYYPNQGQVVQPQTQPLPAGPVYRAPQGNNQTVPPAARRNPQQLKPDAQQTLDAERAAYNAEKLSLVERLLEKYKASAAENQGAIEQLQSMKQENVELRRRMGELDSSSKSYQARVLTLEEKLAAAGQTNPAAMQEAEQLKASYQGVVTQVKNLEAKVQELSGEKQNYLNQIASLKAAQEEAMNSKPVESNQAELAEKNRQLATDKRALEQQNQQLNQEYTTLKTQYQEYETLKTQYQNLTQQQRQAQNENQQLSDRIVELSNSFSAGQVPDVAAMTARVPTADSSPMIAVTQPSIDVSSFETKISQLTRKNRQLSESNSEFKAKNLSLSRQLSSLKDPSGPVAVANLTPANVSAALPAAIPTAAAAVEGSEGGWGVWGWLLPFLAIGLGVAFFVIIKEELHRKPAGATDRSSR